MRTTRAVNAMLALTALVVSVAAGCSHGSGAKNGRTVQKKSTTTNWYAPATPAAFAAIDKVRIATPGRDCGGGPLDGGWPTTAAFTQPSTCLRDTDRAGKAAFMNYTGQTSENGEYRIVLTTTGAHAMSVIVVLANQLGAVRRDEWRCPVPTKPILLTVFFPGRRVEPSIVGDEHCDRATR